MNLTVSNVLSLPLLCWSLICDPFLSLFFSPLITSLSLYSCMSIHHYQLQMFPYVYSMFECTCFQWCQSEFWSGRWQGNTVSRQFVTIWYFGRFIWNSYEFTQSHFYFFEIRNREKKSLSAVPKWKHYF